MKVGILTFVRLDSQRLPKKAFRALGQYCLLEWVVRRCQKVQFPDTSVIIATSKRQIDNPVETFAQKHGGKLFRGDLADVLARAYHCAQHYDLDAIVRISADSPFIDPRLIEDMLVRYAEHPDKVITNLHPRRYPPGQSVEILPFAVLQSLHENCKDPALREHVTPLLYQEDSPYGYVHFDNPHGDQSGYGLTVDTAQDLHFLSQVAVNIDLNTGLQEVLSVYDGLKERDLR